jgi:nicotinamide-nucleotide amidase
MTAQATDAELETLAIEVGEALRRGRLMLAVAESCTGGWAAQAITSVAGSSAWFDRGFVTYTNISKHELLGVPAETLKRYGAVSEQTARAMAEGALRGSHADVALAITGIAGPGGGSPEKPVGMVCLAWTGRGRATVVRTEHFSGDRAAIRRQAVRRALAGIIAFVGESGQGPSG